MDPGTNVITATLELWMAHGIRSRNKGAVLAVLKELFLEPSSAPLVAGYFIRDVVECFGLDDVAQAVFDDPRYTAEFVEDQKSAASNMRADLIGSPVSVGVSLGLFTGLCTAIRTSQDGVAARAAAQATAQANAEQELRDVLVAFQKIPGSPLPQNTDFAEMSFAEMSAVIKGHPAAHPHPVFNA